MQHDSILRFHVRHILEHNHSILVIFHRRRDSNFNRLCVIFHAGSRINFSKTFPTHISKRELKNGHISRIFSVFQVIQEISPAKFFSAEEVDLRFNSETKEHPQISKPSFGKETVKTFFYKCSNSGRNESTPQTQNNVSWISYQVKQISKSRS